jgi:DNA-binding transcriptional MerR regulator
LTLDLAQGCTLFFVPESYLQIGQVAALAGVTVDAVRYYEKRLLLNRAPRSTGNFRLFTSDAVERIQFIKQAQEMGLSLDEIKELFTSDGGAPQCQRVRDLLKEKIRELDDRMKKLRKFRSSLSHHLEACEDELQQHGTAAACPVIVTMTHTRKAKDNEAKTNK